MADRRAVRRRALGLMAVMAMLLPSATARSRDAGPMAPWLREAVGLSDDDLEALGRGHAVARHVDTLDASESSTAGAVIIHAPLERLLAEYRHIETGRRGPGVLAIGAFSDPPSAADLAGFSLTEDDLGSLRRCRTGACGLKLPAAAIERFRAEVTWASPAAAAQATAVMRDWMLDRLRRYRIEGNDALGYADDKRRPLNLAGELAAVLVHDTWLPTLAPHVLAYLAGAPGTHLLDDTFYWARVAFGMKPTVRLNHVSIHRTPGAPFGLSHVIATKQIHASHYLRAALELRLIFPRPDGGFLLVMATRSRNDGMTGLLGFVVRTKVRGRSRDGMIRYLQNVKSTVESGRRGEVVGAP